MIIYKELRIQDNVLHFHLSVEQKEYYSNIRITGVKIDTPLTYGTDTPYQLIMTPASTTDYEDSCILPALNQQFIIVTPIIAGVPGANTPCGKDIIDVGAVYNKEYTLNKGLIYLRELGNNCLIPKGFIDYILKTKALDMSIATCNYTEAINYWDYLANKPVKTSTNNCGCNGFNQYYS